MSDGLFWNRAEVPSSSPSESNWSPGDSPTGFGSNQYNLDFESADKKERHKLVERNRRDKTRAFVQQLQVLIPNASDRSANPNINVILENTLEFLQTIKIESSESEASEEDAESIVSEDLTTARSDILSALTGSPYDDLLARRAMFTFQQSPVAMVIARVDGSVITANPCFENYFKFARGGVKGCTLFSLTAQADLPKVMQVWLFPNSQ